VPRRIKGAPSRRMERKAKAKSCMTGEEDPIVRDPLDRIYRIGQNYRRGTE
jgi:hypothetical protein